jgi:CRISPR/Cas system-associated protein Csx1
MDISVTSTSRQTALGNEYLYVEMQCGKHAAIVVVCRGATNYVQVVVQNAMNRAWRGMGKRFASLDAALKAYKTDAIKEMISTACEMQAA